MYGRDQIKTMFITVKRGRNAFNCIIEKMTITINHHVNQDIKNTPNFWGFFYQMIVYSIADDILKSQVNSDG